MIIAVTIVNRMFVRPGWGPDEFSFAWLWDSTLWENVLRVDRAWLLNVALFAPAGFFWLRFFQRIPLVVTGAVVLSLAIESLQGWLDLGIPEPEDILTNALGAAIGAAVCRLSSKSRTPGEPLSSTSSNDIA